MSSSFEDSKAKNLNYADDLSHSEASISMDDRTAEMSHTTGSGVGSVSPTSQIQSLFMSRFAMAILLIMVATAAGVTVFFVTSNTEESSFESLVSHTNTVAVKTSFVDLANFLLLNQIVLRCRS